MTPSRRPAILAVLSVNEACEMPAEVANPDRITGLLRRC